MESARNGGKLVIAKAKKMAAVPIPMIPAGEAWEKGKEKEADQKVETKVKEKEETNLVPLVLRANPKEKVERSPGAVPHQELQTDVHANGTRLESVIKETNVKCGTQNNANFSKKEIASLVTIVRCLMGARHERHGLQEVLSLHREA